ncbi:MAG: hypothetical protein ACRCUY_00810 [Thermoguttaceae bacterium]
MTQIFRKSVKKTILWKKMVPVISARFLIGANRTKLGFHQLWQNDKLRPDAA